MRWKLPFNPNKPLMQAIVAVVVLLLLAALATRCAYAAPPPAYARFAAGSTILRGETSALDLAVVWPDRVTDADLAVGVTFIGPSRLYDQPQTNNFAWRAELRDGFGPVTVGLGLAVLQNADIYNSGRMNFTLSLGYTYRRLTLEVRHFSNGGTSRPNKGRDILLVAWQF